MKTKTWRTRLNPDEQVTVNSVDGGVMSTTSRMKGIVTTAQFDRSRGVLLNYLMQFAESGTTI